MSGRKFIGPALLVLFILAVLATSQSGGLVSAQTQTTDDGSIRVSPSDLSSLVSAISGLNSYLTRAGRPSSSLSPSSYAALKAELLNELRGSLPHVSDGLASSVSASINTITNAGTFSNVAIQSGNGAFTSLDTGTLTAEGTVTTNSGFLANGGVVGAAWRTNQGLAVERLGGAGITLFNKTNPGPLITSEEDYVAYGSYDAAGQAQKLGAVSLGWIDTSTTTGYSVHRIQDGYFDGINRTLMVNEVAMRLFGGHGAGLWSGDSAPGPAIFDVHGQVMISSPNQNGGTSKGLLLKSGAIVFDDTSSDRSVYAGDGAGNSRQLIGNIGGVITVDASAQGVAFGGDAKLANNKFVRGFDGATYRPLIGMNAGVITVDGNGVGTTFGGSVAFSTAASRLVPGATSFAIRNNANTQDNVIVTDAGIVTLLNDLRLANNQFVRGNDGSTYRPLIGMNAGVITIDANGVGAAFGGPVTFSAAISRIIPGSTSFAIRNNANSSDNLLITDAGAVTARAGLTVNGSVTLPFIPSGAGTAYLCTTLATGAVSSSTSACNPSSIRFKENVQTLAGARGLDLIKQLRPVTYTYKPEMLIPGNQLGFIAEEVYPLVPEVVGLDASGTPANIDYAKLTPVIVKAIQELAATTTATTTDGQVITFSSGFVENLGYLGGRVVGGALHLVELAVDKLTATDVDTQHLRATDAHVDQLCIGSTCVTESQFQQILQQSGGGTVSQSFSSGDTTDASSSPDTSTTTSPTQ